MANPRKPSGLMGLQAKPSSYKRSQMPNAGPGHSMVGRTATTQVPKGRGMVSRSYGKAEIMGNKGGETVGTGAAKPAYGPKTTSGATKLGTQGITSQGDKAGGQTQGHARTSRGKNNIGSGRQQTTRG